MFNSIFRKVWNHSPMRFPAFTGTRIMMMPVRLGHSDGIPNNYRAFVAELYGMVEARFFGQIGYLTIDEQIVKAGKSLRRAGKHVDGYYNGKCGAWGGGGGWGSVGNGMLTVSSTAHCRAYLGQIEGSFMDAEGLPLAEGECDHLIMPNEGTLFEAGHVYWVDGACVHESMPVTADTTRQFVRLSMPSNGPWFEGYTKNPAGILPSNEVLPARTAYMENGDVDA